MQMKSQNQSAWRFRFRYIRLAEQESGQKRICGWIPGKLAPDILSEGWQLVYDDSNPTCRAVDAPYNNERAKLHDWQYHVIDGFIISPNVEMRFVNTIDLDFQDSDHNPVRLGVVLR